MVLRAHGLRGFLKLNKQNHLSKSATYKKQLTFKGSNRQIRGAIIRYLTYNKRGTLNTFRTSMPFTNERISEQLERLLQEKMIEKVGQSFKLPN